MIVTAVVTWLAVCAWLDYRYREISNWLTVPPALAAGACAAGRGRWAFLVGWLLVIAAWRLGVYGGADMKILLALVALWPQAEFAMTLCLTISLLNLALLVQRYIRNNLAGESLSLRALTAPMVPAIYVAVSVWSFVAPGVRMA